MVAPQSLQTGGLFSCAAGTNDVIAGKFGQLNGPAPHATSSGSDQDGLPNLRFYYVFKNKATVQQRLLQAGIRLAGVLNAIFT